MFGQERDAIACRDLDIRNPDLPEANDVPLVRLGNVCRFGHITFGASYAGIHIHERHDVESQGL